ncbi:hypothetical protein Hypma_004942 [Hypsizygus marmoreus]|uniref:Uncharacterized protein n=1 Tax=Hypsizygus marmoreus TaxID=39966 RepID=A0A369K5A3_HYPMA|nr:hypothetical protein Hypma_004942 [Hypsizygus marmoreus]
MKSNSSRSTRSAKTDAPHSDPALKVHEWDDRSRRYAIVNTVSRDTVSRSPYIPPYHLLIRSNSRNQTYLLPPCFALPRKPTPDNVTIRVEERVTGALGLRRRIYSGQKRVIAVLRTALRFPPPTRVDGTVSDGENLLPLPAGGRISEYLHRETRLKRFTENRINERSRCYAPLRNTTEHNGHPRMTEASTWEELVAATRNSREEKAGFGCWRARWNSFCSNLIKGDPDVPVITTTNAGGGRGF